jgi:hypothetical protein
MILFFQNMPIFWVIWFIVSLLFFIFIQYLVHKRKKYHPQQTEFNPPENISPLLAGFLVDKKFHVRDYVAGFTYLIEQNIISPNKLKPQKDTFDAKILNSASVHCEKIAIQKKYLEKGLSFFQSGLIYGFMFLLFFSGSIMYIKHEIINKFDVTAVSILFIFSIPFFIYIMYEIIFLSENKLTKKGRRIKNSLLGFKTFLETAESDRIDFFNNIKSDSFTRYLPYAIALGVEKKWTKKYSRFVVDVPFVYPLQNMSLPSFPDRINNIVDFIELVEKTKENEVSE